MRGWALAILLVVSVAHPTQADSSAEAEKYDADQDRRLDPEELRKYFNDKDPAIKELRDKGKNSDADELLEDRVRDARTIRGYLKASLSISEAAQAFNDIAVPPRSGRKKIGWPGLGFARFVTDTPDPKGGKFKVPLVFSHTYDDTATDKHQTSALGGVQLAKGYFGSDDAWTITPAIEADITGSKPASESSLQFGLPISWFQYWEDRAVESFTLTVSPTYGTDRRLKRDLWELITVAELTSEQIGRAGFWTYAGFSEEKKAALKFYWLPRLRLELGEVNDPAGNQKLAALAASGRYLRSALHVSLKLRPERLSERITFDADLFERYDFEEGEHHAYGEGRFHYALLAGDAAKGETSVTFSVVYRRGRKPPDFARANAVLVGIGILQ